MPMSAIQNKPYMSEAEYLELERASETKHEYFGGRTSVVAKENIQHKCIRMSMIAALYTQSSSAGYQLHSNTLRLKIKETSCFCYPDLAIYPHNIQYLNLKQETATNPLIIIEVLSPSTELHDRNIKFLHYQHIPSLQEYVLVSQDSPRIEVFRRQKDKDTWLFVDTKGLDGEIEFPTIEAVLALANAYEQVTFPEKSDNLGKIE